MLEFANNTISFIAQQAGAFAANAATSGIASAAYRVPFDVTRTIVAKGLNWASSEKKLTNGNVVSQNPVASKPDFEQTFSRTAFSNYVANVVIEQLSNPNNPLYNQVPASMKSWLRRLVVTLAETDYEKFKDSLKLNNMALDIINCVARSYLTHYGSILLSDYLIDCDNNPEKCSAIAFAATGAAVEVVVFGFGKVIEAKRSRQAELEIAKVATPAQLQNTPKI